MPSLGTRSGLQNESLNLRRSVELPQETYLHSEQPCRVSGPGQTSSPRHRFSRARIPQKTSLEFRKGLETALRGSPEYIGDHGISRQQEPNWEVKISSTRSILKLQWFQDWHGGELHSKGHVQPLRTFTVNDTGATPTPDCSPSEIDRLCVAA